jgi:hypothetical protein
MDSPRRFLSRRATVRDIGAWGSASSDGSRAAFPQSVLLRADQVIQ